MPEQIDPEGLQFAHEALGADLQTDIVQPPQLPACSPSKVLLVRGVVTAFMADLSHRSETTSTVSYRQTQRCRR